MNLQQIYNATYHEPAEENVWPQYISYNSRWENSKNVDIKHSFDLEKKDGLNYYLKKRYERNYDSTC